MRVLGFKYGLAASREVEDLVKIPIVKGETWK
jgi:hypothetical protein